MLAQEKILPYIWTLFSVIPANYGKLRTCR